MAKYKLPQRGDRISDIQAAALRAAIRAGEAYEAGILAPRQQPEPTPLQPVNEVTIYNDTGISLPEFSVLGIGEPLAAPRFNTSDPQDTSSEERFIQKNIFNGVLPSVEKHWSSFAVLQHPVPDGGLGRAVVSGTTKALVDIPNNAEHYERVGIDEAYTDALVVHPGGSGQIIWRNREPVRQLNAQNTPEDTNLWWCVIRFDQVPAGWTKFRNLHHDVVPPYAVMRREESVESSDGNFTSIVQPGATSTTGQRLRYLVNGPVQVPASGYGYAYEGSDPVWVKISLTQESDHNPYQNWGPVAGQWHIAQDDGDEITPISAFGYTLTELFTDDNGLDERALCKPEHPEEFKCTLDDDLDPDQEGVATIAQTGTQDGRKIHVRSNWAIEDTLPKDKEVMVRWMPYEEAWVIYNADVSGEAGGSVIRIQFNSQLSPGGSAPAKNLADPDNPDAVVEVHDYLLVAQENVSPGKKGAAVRIGGTYWLISVQCE